MHGLLQIVKFVSEVGSTRHRLYQMSWNAKDISLFFFCFNFCIVVPDTIIFDNFFKAIIQLTLNSCFL